MPSWSRIGIKLSVVPNVHRHVRCPAAEEGPEDHEEGLSGPGAVARGTPKLGPAASSPVGACFGVSPTGGYKTHPSWLRSGGLEDTEVTVGGDEEGNEEA